MTGPYNNTMKTLLASSIIAVTLSLAGCGGAGETEQDASKHVKRGETYLEQGQFKAALIEARNALQKAPTDLGGHLLMTDILLQTGQAKSALIQLESIEGNNAPDYLFSKAETLISMQKYRSADKLLNQNQKLLQADNAEKFLEFSGSAQLGLNNIQEARDFFQQLQTLTPNAERPLLLLARTAAVEKDFTLAKGLLEQALSKNSEYVDALVLKANILFNENNLAAAEDALTNALTSLDNTDIITPERATILKSLSRILTLQGRSTEALVYTRLLADAVPGLDIANDKLQEAVSLYKEKDLDGAKEKLQEILQEFPNYEQAGQLLAIVNYLQGNLTEANNFFTEQFDPELASDQLNTAAALTSLRLNKPEQVVAMLEEEAATSDNANILALYGIAALSSSNSANGEKAILKSISITPNPQLRLALAQYYNQQAEEQLALEQIKTAYNSDKTDPVLQNALVSQHLLMNAPDKGLQLVTEILKKYPKNASSHLLAGKFYLSQDQRKQALSSFTTANQLDANNLGTVLGIAQLQLLEENFEEATSQFLQATKLAPENPAAYKGLITVSELQSTPQQGINKLLSIAEETDATAPLLVLAEYYTRNNNLQKAKEIATLIEDKSPENKFIKSLNSLIAYQEAVDALGQKNYPQARAASLRGLEHTPDSIPLLTTLADTEIYSGNEAEARKLIEQITPLNPLLAHHLQGNLALTAKSPDLDVALSEYLTAWKLQASDILGNKIYSLHQRLNQTSEANRFLQEWLELSPNSPSALAASSIQSIAQEDYPSAIQTLEKLTQLQPEAASHWNNLAWSYLQRKSLEKAVAAAEKAHSLAPESPAVLDTYGWALYKRGDTDKALELLTKASNLAPDNQEIQAHLKTAQNK